VPNRLADATSPYLLQHADNPVDWWQWSEDAFAEARRRDVPVLLSVGYAACHWCHVMAHESFEDAGTAAQMNAGFINVKVDREERPDVDAVYMEATQAMTGHGGWPMTCLLTADGAPFFAGTYFPRAQFRALLDAATTAWRDRRAEVVESGQRVVTVLSRRAAPGHPVPEAADLAAAVETLRGQFDTGHAGFGAAPKFPPSMVIEFLLRHHERTGDTAALHMAGSTLTAMARGGIYDQLAGGFARYSVDRAWVVPHFEKMLYDNALLLRVYLHWWRRTDEPLAERIARETAEFLLRDLGTAEGGFASALDADTDGVEGSTYVWTPDQLREVLGADAPAAAGLFAVTESGTFEQGSSTLQLLADPPDVGRWADLRARLLTARAARPQPARDDKVVTAWNGLAIAALAEASVLLGDERYLSAAAAAADLILGLHRVDGRLRRSSRGGTVGAPLGVLEDYGDLAEGLLALHQATAEGPWLAAAGELLDVALELFVDADGTVWDTASDAAPLVRRPWDPTDGATPAGSSALAGGLLSHAALSGSERHREAAERLLTTVTWLGRGQPRFLGWLLAVAEAWAGGGPVQVAVVGEGGTGPLTTTAWRHRGAGAVVVSGTTDAPGVPLLAHRPAGETGRAYVCRGMVCDAPVSDVGDLVAALRG
jgi:uncharacterized protein